MKSQVKFPISLYPIFGITLAVLLILSGCGQKMDLPNTPQSVAFGSGDTTYIQLAPDWTVNDGLPLSEPCDIVIGEDGFAFVADRGNNRIACFDRVGNTLDRPWIDHLADVSAWAGTGPDDVIEAIGQDEKLNLYIATGSPTIWYWNQYINEIGIQYILDSLIVYDTADQDTSFMDFGEWFYLDLETPQRYVILDAYGSDDPDRIDSLYRPNVFFTDPNPNRKFRGVAGGPDETVYITDLTDRVFRLALVYDGAVILKNGFSAYTFHGEFDQDVAGWGHGMGTTIDPAGVYVQVQGSQHFIYFTQTKTGSQENFFPVQKIREEGVGDFFSAFSASSDIMQLDRFANPMDIWVAEQYLGNNWVFVADTDSNRVQVFNPVGDFLMYAGGRPIATDSTSIEVFDLLDTPEGVAHYEGMLYVTDTGNNRIVRYALSSDVENIPGQ
ncbi:hypothetical protein KJ564_05475 [bacterium]|nr:hypothetical protein [bacterium]MBU1881001.1 hypothetical protein [bacterium]